MNKKILSVLIILVSIFCFGQKKIIPKDIIKLVKVDTLQANQILQIIENEGNDSIWMSYNEKLISLLQKTDFNTIKPQLKKSFIAALSSCFGNKGYFYTNVQPDFKKAMYFYNKSIYFSNSINDTKAKIGILKNIGSCQHNNGELEESLKTFEQAYKYAVSENDISSQVNLLSQIANYYSVKGAETKALEIFTKALKIVDKTNDEETKANTRRLMAIIYIRQKEFDVAIKLLKLNYNYYASKPTELPKFVENQYNLSNIYFKTKNKSLFTYYSNKGILLAKKTENIGALSNFYRIKRAFFVTEQKIDSAKKYTDLNLNLISKIKAEPDFSLALLDASDIFKIKGQYEKAESLGVLAFNNLKKIGFNSDLQKSSRNLKEIYKRKNQFKEALFYADLELKIIDSLATINIENSAIKSMFAYETEKKEAAIKTLSQKNRISQLESSKKSTLLYLMLLFFTAIATTVYVLFSRYNTKKQNEILQNKLVETQNLLEAEKKVADSEFKALKSQMNPHFIFNALNGIQAQFMYGDKYLANEQLNNFTHLTRQIMEVSGKKQITICEELDLLDKYLQLERMRFKTNFEFDLRFSDAIDADYHKIPPMLLQPIVENSVKHGLLHKKGSKKVSVFIDIDAQETHLICTVSDNGIGRKMSENFKENSKIKHNSFSTFSILQRLELLNHNLQITNLLAYFDVVENGSVSGTKVVIKVPII